MLDFKYLFLIYLFLVGCSVAEVSQPRSIYISKSTYHPPFFQITEQQASLYVIGPGNQREHFWFRVGEVDFPAKASPRKSLPRELDFSVYWRVKEKNQDRFNTETAFFFPRSSKIIFQYFHLYENGHSFSSREYALANNFWSVSSLIENDGNRFKSCFQKISLGCSDNFLEAHYRAPVVQNYSGNYFLTLVVDIQGKSQGEKHFSRWIIQTFLQNPASSGLRQLDYLVQKFTKTEERLVGHWKEIYGTSAFKKNES